MQRLQRNENFLQPQQRAFLNLLPLLFHGNFPNLPGFVSSKTPAGLPGYFPTKQTLSFAKRLARSFVYKRRLQADFQLCGLYLMGSVGSIAYSDQSDLDIWLCHQPALEDMDELQEKILAIEKWAESLGLEAHVFLIDVEKFRLGIGSPISKESCGSIQHHLLLEEFYRTGIYIAGRIPAWWLVPPQEEHNYDYYLDHLLEKRFIDAREIIDFGSIGHIAMEEFLGASRWHLYKAIASPYKSLLKLLLMEVYASEYPDPQWLSLQLKRSVYEGHIEIDRLDPYIMMMEKIEAYLLNLHAVDRLELARRCFYIKINQLLSEETGAARQSYQRSVIQEMIWRWGWEAARVAQLDRYKHWKIDELIREHAIISSELKRGYRFFEGIMREYVNEAALEHHEIKLLRAKLKASFEKRPGKIELVAHSETKRLAEDQLSLHEIELADGDWGWALYQGQYKRAAMGSRAPVKKTRNLIEIMAWMVLNGLYTQTTSVYLESSRNPLRGAELRYFLVELAKFLHKRAQASKDLQVYARSAHIHSVALCINIGHDALPSNSDIHITSNRFDPLSYGAARKNLIHSVEQLSVNSHQEVLASRIAGLTGLFDLMVELLNDGASETGEARRNLLDLECYCYASHHAMSIIYRIKQVFADLYQHFNERGGARAHYVLRGGGAYYIFQRQRQTVSYTSEADDTAFYKRLAAPHPDYISYRFDAFALEDAILALVYGYNKPGVVQIFYAIRQELARIYILDERGALYQRVHAYSELPFLLEPYILFLAAVRQRHGLFTEQSLEYFRIQSKDELSALRISFMPKPRTHYFEVRVTGEELLSKRISYTLYCNEQEFSSLDHGEDLFRQAAQYIIEQRRSPHPYPIYLTDVDVPLSAMGLSAPQQLQTVCLLNYRKTIEDWLNCHLKSLPGG